jgi:hypothetical protein
MIKCFVVENLDSKTPKGKFERNAFYLAKISNNQPNTLAVLDENLNWVPFEWHSKGRYLEYNHCRLYFYAWDNFIIDNKKELNRYVRNSNMYN